MAGRVPPSAQAILNYPPQCDSDARLIGYCVDIIRVFKTKEFARIARRDAIRDATLLEASSRAERV
jgi:hypothetical protein